MWTIPSTVSIRAASHVLDGSRPMVRSVPGPSNRRESKRRAVEPGGGVRQLRDPGLPGGDRVRFVEPADVRDLLPQPLQRRRRLEPRVHQRGPPERRARDRGPVGGASLMTAMPSGTAGSMSRPSRAGSTSSMIRGATGPVRPMRAQRCSPSAVARAPIHGGTKPRVSRSACSARARLRCTSNTLRSTNRAPAA